MNTDQNQTSFSRDEIVSQLEAALSTEKDYGFPAVGRLQTVLERAHLDGLAVAGLVDVTELEGAAANAFGRPVADVVWGFTRLPATTPLGVRRPDLERLTGSRLQQEYDVTLMERGGQHRIEVGENESYLATIRREPTPWDISCEEGEVVVLSAWLSKYRDLDDDGEALRTQRQAERTARLDEVEAASTELSPRDHARALLAVVEELRREDAEADLTHLPVLALPLGASAELDGLLAEAAVLKAEQRVAALLEKPLTTVFSLGEDTLLGDVLALDRADTTRARAAYAAALEAAAATRRAQAGLRRCQAQRILMRLGLGRINHVEPGRLASLAPREIVECSQAVVRAYPSASLAGGFFYLLGKPEGFDEFWARFRDANDPLVSRLEHWASESHGPDTDDWSAEGPTIERASVDDLTAILTEGLVAVVEMALRPEDPSVDLSRSLALSVGAKGFVEEILSFTSTDVEADREIATDTERTPRERAEAMLRLAGFLANDVHAGPAGEDSPFLTSELHLGILPVLPPTLRIALVRPGGEHQVTWRKMLSESMRRREAAAAAR